MQFFKIYFAALLITLKTIIWVSNVLLFVRTHSYTESYQGTVRGPGVGLTAGSAACVELSYSATAVNPVCCRTVRGHTPAHHV